MILRLLTPVAIGLFFVASVLWALTKTEGLPAPSVEHVFHEEHPKALHLASDGPGGHFDRQQLQRGYQVYKEVCAACHALGYVAFRDLAQLGYDEGQVKAEAATWNVPHYNAKTGELATAPGLPVDHFPPVIYGGQGTPPDLSLIAKARHGGAAYTYSLLTGYADQPAALLRQFPDATMPDGLYFNPYFANLNIAMPPPLADGQVTYADGTEASVDQMAQDVSAFLVWTAEPSLEKRNQTGWPVVLFLLFATILAYLAYRNIWADKKH